MSANGAAGDEDEFMMAVAEAGGDDYEDAGDEWIVWTTDPSSAHGRRRRRIEEQGVQVKGCRDHHDPHHSRPRSPCADAKKVHAPGGQVWRSSRTSRTFTSTMDITDEIAEALEED